MMDAETIVCDLCGTNDTAVLYTNADWKLPGLDKFALVQCNQCGLIYLNPRPMMQTIGQFYTDEYAPFRKAIEDERFFLMRWARQRNMTSLRKTVEKYLSVPSASVLDVGCATGLFLNEMSKSGWQTTGIELSPIAAEYAQQRFGLSVFQGTIEDAPFSAKSFDLITFWDVLEHTFSPRQALKRSAELLKDGGILAINVPQSESFDRKWFGAQWIGFDPPRHLYVFSRKTLGTLLHESGFDILGWETPISPYFSFVISLEQYLQSHYNLYTSRMVGSILRFPGMRLFFTPYIVFANLYKRSGIVSVFAKKR